MRDKLLAFREEIQGMCFYWKTTHRHGHCKEANGMDHVCAFCELTEKLESLLSDEKPSLLIGVNEALVRLDELKQLAADYRARGYRPSDMLTVRIGKLEGRHHRFDTESFSE